MSDRSNLNNIIINANNYDLSLLHIKDCAEMNILYITAHFLALSQTADYSVRVTVLHYFVLKDLFYFLVCLFVFFLRSFCEFVLRQSLFILDFFIKKRQSLFALF